MTNKLKVQKEVTIRMEQIDKQRYVHVGDLLRLINLCAGTSESLNAKRDLNSLAEILVQGEMVDE
jgi:hypothetical protein